MSNKQKAKEAMLKEGINTENDANNFMDKVLNKLTNEQLKRAYKGAKKKYDRKQNSSTKYVLLYITKKMDERSLKHDL